MYSIVGGNSAEILEASSGWQEALGAILLYVDPSVHSFNLEQYVQNCCDGFVEEDNAVSDITRCMLELRTTEALTRCEEYDYCIFHYSESLMQRTERPLRSL